MIAFFLPFEKSVVTSNIRGKSASREWAKAYVETNALIQQMGQHLRECIEPSGHDVLLKNEETYKSLGTADVCGKCLVAIPCATTDPVSALPAQKD